MGLRECFLRSVVVVVVFPAICCGISEVPLIETFITISPHMWNTWSLADVNTSMGRVRQEGMNLAPAF